MPGSDLSPNEFWGIVEEVLNEIQEEKEKQ